MHSTAEDGWTSLSTFCCGGYRITNVVPASRSKILKGTLAAVKIRANSNGECFDGDIADSIREAGLFLRVDRLEILLTRTMLARTMESPGESYRAEVPQDCQNRMPVSKALKYLSEAIVYVENLTCAPESSPDEM